MDRLRLGHRVAREGWNGKNMWIRMIDLYNDAEFSIVEEPDADGTWVDFIVIKTPDNTLHPWNASQADMFANDWEVVDG